MWNIINTIIGAIGCITGTVSIILIIRQNKFSQGKLIVELAEPIGAANSFYFDPEREIINCKYKSSCAVALSLKVINQSAYPVSLDDFVLKNGSILCHHDQEFKFRPFNYQLKNTAFWHIDFAPSVTLPVRLEPFETRIIGLRFPFAGKGPLPTPPLSATIEIKTSRKPLKIDVKLQEYRSYMEEAAANYDRQQRAENADRA